MAIGIQMIILASTVLDDIRILKQREIVIFPSE